jgi:hypothetical protein
MAELASRIEGEMADQQYLGTIKYKTLKKYANLGGWG